MGENVKDLPSRMVFQEYYHHMPEEPNNASPQPSAFVSLLARYLRYPISKKPRYYFLVVISIIIISYGLFFYIQHTIEDDTRNRLMNEQTERQIEDTKKLSTDVTSDLVSVMAIMQGLANSQYLQEGDLNSEAARNLVQETFSKINSFTVVDKLFVPNRSDVVTMFMAAEGENTPFFGADEVSFKDLMQEAKSRLEPVYTGGFKGTDGTQRIALIFPVVGTESGDYLGSIVGLIPTVKFFEHYGNVHDINSQYLNSIRLQWFLSKPPIKEIGRSQFFWRRVPANNKSQPRTEQISQSSVVRRKAWLFYIRLWDRGTIKLCISHSA